MAIYTNLVYIQPVFVVDNLNVYCLYSVYMTNSLSSDGDPIALSRASNVSNISVPAALIVLRYKCQ